jgi:hypothetical protein
MKIIDGPLRRDTNSRDKERGLALDDNVNKLRELTSGVVTLYKKH